MTYEGGVLFGMGFGAITPARAALLAEFYGPAHYGRINSLLAFAITCARAVAPLGAGVLYTLSGGYTSSFWTLTAASSIAGWPTRPARAPSGCLPSV